MNTFSTLRKTISYLVVILLAISYSLPVEGHLKICIGYDGHIDVEAHACETKSPIGQPEQIIGSDDHHNECIDFESTCDSNFDCKAFHLSPSLKFQRDRSPTIFNIIVKKMDDFYSSSVQNVSLFPFPYPPSKQNSPDTLRSVVLLI